MSFSWPRQVVTKERCFSFSQLVAQIAERADLTKAKAERLAAFQAVLAESGLWARPS